MQRTRSSRAGGDEEDPGSDDYDRKRKGGAGRKAVGLCCVVLACWVLSVVPQAWMRPRGRRPQNRPSVQRRRRPPSSTSESGPTAPRAAWTTTPGAAGAALVRMSYRNP